jgi:hypothetical protein
MGVTGMTLRGLRELDNSRRGVRMRVRLGRMVVIMCVVEGVRGMIMIAVRMPAMRVTLKVN